MIISFDIDNTLIPYSSAFEVEHRNFLHKAARVEPLRKGTIKLFKALEKNGHEIWIYTSSLRSTFSLKKTFKAYGLKPQKFINGSMNHLMLKQHNCSASKNPKLFGIDLHIDDSKGVGMEGEQYGFRTIIVSPDDKRWVNFVLNNIIRS